MTALLDTDVLIDYLRGAAGGPTSTMSPIAALPTTGLGLALFVVIVVARRVRMSMR